MSKTIIKAAALATILGVGPVWAAAPSNEELYESIKALEAELKARDEQAAKEKKAAESSMFKAQNVKFGGYGELHYNNLIAEDHANDVREIDFHRFVLFMGYDFSDSIRFVSEVEIEHSIAADGEGGEVELEQAYVEFDLNSTWRARGSVMLLPVGILNETHEPPTFYGVERNDVENIIIPSTWWAGGASVVGNWSNGLQWDFMVHEGLMVPTAGGSAFRVRSGRQKTSEADASDLAATTRLSYSGLPGLKMGASLSYQSDASQVDGDGLEEALLYVVNLQADRGPFSLRALYGAWDMSGSAVEAADDDDQSGWYIEPSYKFCEKIGLYTRYEDIEGARSQDEFDQWEVGVNFWPHPSVVIKADYRSRSHDLNAEAGRDFDGFDLGIGYQF